MTKRRLYNNHFIADLYANKHWKQIDIAKYVGLTKQRISQIIKQAQREASNTPPGKPLSH